MQADAGKRGKHPEMPLKDGEGYEVILARKGARFLDVQMLKFEYI